MPVVAMASRTHHIYSPLWNPSRQETHSATAMLGDDNVRLFASSTDCPIFGGTCFEFWQDHSFLETNAKIVTVYLVD